MTETVKAADVLDALTSKWPDSEHLHVREAPNDPARQGRKLDLVVVSLWASRGFELDGVEVKVSASDWKRELDNPAKADWWVKHVHRFWIAVPAALAPRVKSELPTGWGLLAVTAADPGHPVRVVVKPERRTPEPMSWGTTVGLMRAAADAGFGALQRAEERGRRLGREQGIAEGKRTTSAGHLQHQVDQLRAQVAEFEAASGIKLTDQWRHGPAEVGEAVAAVLDYRRRPQRLVEATRHSAEALRRQAANVDELADALAAALTPAPDTAEVTP